MKKGYKWHTWKNTTLILVEQLTVLPIYMWLGFSLTWITPVYFHWPSIDLLKFQLCCWCQPVGLIPDIWFYFLRKLKSSIHMVISLEVYLFWKHMISTNRFSCSFWPSELDTLQLKYQEDAEAEWHVATKSWNNSCNPAILYHHGMKI